VRTRRSESHCHPPREMRRGGMGRLAMRAITAHRAWPLREDDGRLCGWCASEGAVAFEAFNAVEQVVECRPSGRAARVEQEIEMDHTGGYRDGATLTPALRLHSTHHKSRCSGSEEASELRRARHQPACQAKARPSCEPARGRATPTSIAATCVRLKRPNRWKQGIKTTHHTTNHHGSLVHLLQDHQGYVEGLSH